MRLAKWHDRQRCWMRALRVTFLQSRQVFWAGWVSGASGSVRMGCELRESLDASPDASSGTSEASGEVSECLPWSGGVRTLRDGSDAWSGCSWTG